MNRAKSSFLHDLAAETGRLAIWWGSALVILIAIPLLMIVVAQTDWARIIPNRLTHLEIIGAILGFAVIAWTVTVGVSKLRDHLLRHNGRERKAHER
jgi:hypothetical protein